MRTNKYLEEDENGNDITPSVWKDIALDFDSIKRKRFSEVEYIPFYPIKELMVMPNSTDATLEYYSENTYFYYRFGKINGYNCNILTLEDFNITNFLRGLFKNYKVPFDCFQKASINSETFNKTSLSSMVISFKKDLFIHVFGDTQCTVYYNPKYEEAKDTDFYNLLALLKTHKKPKISKNKIFIVYKTMQGFGKVGFDVKKINIDIEKNYNEGFDKISEKIIDGLNSKDKTNLVILSGEPGVGKTTYVRYLTSKLKKNIIFISPDMVDFITDPAFIPFLMKNNDSILIIEDAEPALEKRTEGGRSSAVSNVLNLTDGLLSDCLKISIVATFNTGIRNIDEALTRRGRLLMNYKFEKLSVEKSRQLLIDNGHSEIEVKQPMTLADIYFYGQDNNVEKKTERKLGF